MFVQLFAGDGVHMFFLSFSHVFRNVSILRLWAFERATIVLRLLVFARDASWL